MGFFIKKAGTGFASISVSEENEFIKSEVQVVIL